MVAVVLAQLGVVALGGVAVFHPMFHFIDRAISGVVTDIGFPAGELAEGDELICSEGIGLDDAPGHVIDGLAIGAYAGFPVIAADEAATWPADDGDVEFCECLDDVQAEALFVRQGGSRVEDTAIDLVFEVFEEAAEQHAGVGYGIFLREDIHRGLQVILGDLIRVCGFECDIIEPGLAGGATPASEEAVDFEGWRIGDEGYLDTGPVLGACDGGGADSLHVLDIE
ncbi:MAG: hypothetical protein RI897_3573 [Verrucomicrobiota bacterium]